MGSTVLQSLNKWRDGLLLFESFESPNFMLDQAWTLLNGVPKISNEVAKEGLSSFKLDSTYPWIEKDFSISGDLFGSSAVWFFDDAGIITGGFTPFVEWENPIATLVSGLGVDLAVSTVNYTVMVEGVKSDSGIARTDGFHRFSIIPNASTAFRELYIDGTLVGTTASSGSFDTIRLGCRVASGTNPFGYFDVVQCCRDNGTALIRYSGVDTGRAVELHSADGTLLSTATIIGASAFFRVGLENLDSPFDGYFTMTDTAGIFPYFITPVLSISIGDWYQFNAYSFGRRPSAWNFVDADDRNDLKSLQGVKQSVFFNDSDRVTMTFEDLDEEQKNALDSWWTAAKKGNNFGVAIDSDATYFGRIGIAQTDPDQTAFVVVEEGLAIGSKIVLRDNDGFSKQTFSVVNVILDVVITVSPKPTEPVILDQQVRSLYYWPFCTTTDDGLKAVLTNLTLNKWTVTINFEEAIEP